MFWALKGEGAWRNGDKISVSSESKFQSSLISTGFPYAKVEAGKEYLWSVESVASILPKIQDLRRFGSASLDLCFVADGRFEGFFEIGLMPWDVGAGVLIVQEAGGKISKTDGSNYSLGDFDIVASNGLIHQEFISSIKSWE
jgi:myo-inositol-1(or 4)-monophosphatase